MISLRLLSIALLLFGLAGPIAAQTGAFLTTQVFSVASGAIVEDVHTAVPLTATSSKQLYLQCRRGGAEANDVELHVVIVGDAPIGASVRLQFDRPSQNMVVFLADQSNQPTLWKVEALNGTIDAIYRTSDLDTTDSLKKVFAPAGVPVYDASAFPYTSFGAPVDGVTSSATAAFVDRVEHLVGVAAASVHVVPSAFQVNILRAAADAPACAVTCTAADSMYDGDDGGCVCRPGFRGTSYPTCDEQVPSITSTSQKNLPDIVTSSFIVNGANFKDGSTWQCVLSGGNTVTVEGYYKSTSQIRCVVPAQTLSVANSPYDVSIRRSSTATASNVLSGANRVTVFSANDTCAAATTCGECDFSFCVWCQARFLSDQGGCVAGSDADGGAVVDVGGDAAAVCGDYIVREPCRDRVLVINGEDQYGYITLEGAHYFLLSVPAATPNLEFVVTADPQVPDAGAEIFLRPGQRPDIQGGSHSFYANGNGIMDEGPLEAGWCNFTEGDWWLALKGLTTGGLSYRLSVRKYCEGSCASGNAAPALTAIAPWHGTRRRQAANDTAQYITLSGEASYGAGAVCAFETRRCEPRLLNVAGTNCQAQMTKVACGNEVADGGCFWLGRRVVVPVESGTQCAVPYVEQLWATRNETSGPGYTDYWPHAVEVTVSGSDSCVFSAPQTYHIVGDIDFFSTGRFREDKDGFRLPAGAVDYWRLDTASATGNGGGGTAAAGLFKVTTTSGSPNFALSVQAVGEGNAIAPASLCGGVGGGSETCDTTITGNYYAVSLGSMPPSVYYVAVKSNAGAADTYTLSIDCAGSPTVSGVTPVAGPFNHYSVIALSGSGFVERWTDECVFDLGGSYDKIYGSAQYVSSTQVNCIYPPLPEDSGLTVPTSALVRTRGETDRQCALSTITTFYYYVELFTLGSFTGEVADAKPVNYFMVRRATIDGASGSHSSGGVTGVKVTLIGDSVLGEWILLLGVDALPAAETDEGLATGVPEVVLCRSSSPLFLDGVDKLYIGVQGVQVDGSDGYELRFEDASTACPSDGDVNDAASPSGDGNDTAASPSGGGGGAGSTEAPPSTSAAAHSRQLMWFTAVMMITMATMIMNLMV